MAECGASGSGSSGDSLDKSITLPPDEIFRNLENAKRFAIDIGRRGRARGAGRRGRARARAARPAGRGGGKDEGRGAGRRRARPVGPCSPRAAGGARSPRQPDCSSRQAPRGRSGACRGS